MQIIVRTRGLSCALGRVIGRVMGSENNRDSDEAPQQRRPTTSARWQREAAPIVEDAHHVDEHDEHPGDPVPIAEEDLVSRSSY